MIDKIKKTLNVIKLAYNELEESRKSNSHLKEQHHSLKGLDITTKTMISILNSHAQSLVDLSILLVEESTGKSNTEIDHDKALDILNEIKSFHQSFLKN